MCFECRSLLDGSYSDGVCQCKNAGADELKARNRSSRLSGKCIDCRQAFSTAHRAATNTTRASSHIPREASRIRAPTMTTNYTSTSTMRFARAYEDNGLYHARRKRPLGAVVNAQFVPASSVYRKTRSSSAHGAEASDRGSASATAHAGIGAPTSLRYVTFDMSSPAKRTGSATAWKSGSNESVGKYSGTTASSNREQRVTSGNDGVVEDSSWCTLVRRYDAVEDRAHKRDSHASTSSLRNALIGGLRSTPASAFAKPFSYRESASDGTGAVTSSSMENRGAVSARRRLSLGVARGRDTPALSRVTHKPASSFSDADSAFGGLGDDSSVQKDVDSFGFARSASVAHGTVRGRAAANTFSPRGSRGTTLGRRVSNYPDAFYDGPARHAGSQEDTEIKNDQCGVDTYGVRKTTSQAVGPARGRGAASAFGPRGRGGPMMGRTVDQPRVYSDEPVAESALASITSPSRFSTNVSQPGSYDALSAAGTSQSIDDDVINPTSPTDNNAVGRDGFGYRNVGALSVRGSSHGPSSRGFGTRHVHSRFGAAATDTTNRDSSPPAGPPDGPGGPLHGTAESGSRMPDRACDGAGQHRGGSSRLSREEHETLLHATVPTSRVSSRDASSTSREEAAGDHTACHLCRHVQPSIGHLIVERAFFILALLVVAGAFLLLFFVTASDCPGKLSVPRY